MKDLKKCFFFGLKWKLFTNQNCQAFPKIRRLETPSQVQCRIWELSWAVGSIWIAAKPRFHSPFHSFHHLPKAFWVLGSYANIKTAIGCLKFEQILSLWTSPTLESVVPINGSLSFWLFTVLFGISSLSHFWVLAKPLNFGLFLDFCLFI